MALQDKLRSVLPYKKHTISNDNWHIDRSIYIYIQKCVDSKRWCYCSLSNTILTVYVYTTNLLLILVSGQAVTQAGVPTLLSDILIIISSVAIQSNSS